MTPPKMAHGAKARNGMAIGWGSVCGATAMSVMDPWSPLGSRVPLRWRRRQVWLEARNSSDPMTVARPRRALTDFRTTTRSRTYA